MFEEHGTDGPQFGIAGEGHGGQVLLGMKEFQVVSTQYSTVGISEGAPIVALRPF